jgi:hypothetical protein
MRHTCLSAAVFAAALSLAAPAAFAAATDYRFDLVAAHPGVPGRTDVTVRLTRLPDSRPIAGAIIFQPKAVMAGMADMPADANVEPGPQPGSYVLHVATSMAGPWTLRLSAKVQGEPETLHAAIPFEAGK